MEEGSVLKELSFKAGSIELRALLAKAGLAQAATTANGQFSSKPVAAAAAQSRSRSDRSAAGETSLASESEKDGKW